MPQNLWSSFGRFSMATLRRLYLQSLGMHWPPKAAILVAIFSFFLPNVSHDAKVTIGGYISADLGIFYYFFPANSKTLDFGAGCQENAYLAH